MPSHLPYIIRQSTLVAQNNVITMISWFYIHIKLLCCTTLLVQFLHPYTTSSLICDNRKTCALI